VWKIKHLITEGGNEKFNDGIKVAIAKHANFLAGAG
jgi:hypothetical protein